MASFRKIAVPATRSSAAVLSVRRRIVIVLLVACMLSGLLGLFVALQVRATPPPATGTVPVRLAAVAEQAGRDFLAGRNSSVPAAEGVDTNWSGEQTPTGDPERDKRDLLTGVSNLDVSTFALQGEQVNYLGDVPNQVVHLISFRVTINAAPYLLKVPVLDDPRYGTVLGGEPSLLPATHGSRPVPAADYSSNYADVATDVSDPQIVNAVTRWVQAYAGGGLNDTALKEVTGDTTAHTYSGLGGWTGRLDHIISAVPVPATGDPNAPGGWIVQTEVQLTPPADNSGAGVAPGSAAATGVPMRTTYDLYVVTEGHADLYPVVAWGSAGSIGSLTPYMNRN